ncbi:MAG TPA: VOC family protein [Acidimicrobiia bacterium]|nr:VOC family protein [Acidimicrobiia bacterium]
MSPSVQPIPDGYQRVTPYLSVRGASDAIDFYRKVFGAEERMRIAEPSGRIGHAELVIGDCVVMLSDEYPEMGIVSPPTIGGTAVTLAVYVEDVDATFDAAVQAGATVLRPVENQFYGDRSGQIEDPFGHRWSIQTHVEDVDPEEMGERAAAAMARDH